MNPDEIVKLALQLGALVVSVVVGITGVFKRAFPDADPLEFSIPAGAILTALTWFATQPLPSSFAGWSGFVIVVIIGALLPSGLFDAGVNMLRVATKKSDLLEYEPLSPPLIITNNANS